MNATRIGTRASALALAQSRAVAARLTARWPKRRFTLVAVRTEGDRDLSLKVFRADNTGVFTKALEDALLKGSIDLAVHSLKDLPTELPKGLVLAAVPPREDARDALVSAKRWSLNSLPRAAVVGTASPRRKRQLLLARPDLRVVDLRGNLDTRVRRTVREGRYDAIVVAMAGLKRLGKYGKYARPIPAAQMLPAVGQAALALEARADDRETLRLARALNHAPTETAVRIERVFLKKLRGGCRVPVGVQCRIGRSRVRFDAAVFSTRDASFIKGSFSGGVGRAERLAAGLAGRMLKKGAKRFLEQARA